MSLIAPISMLSVMGPAPSVAGPDRSQTRDPKVGEGVLAQFHVGRYAVEVFPINSSDKSATSSVFARTSLAYAFIILSSGRPLIEARERSA